MSIITEASGRVTVLNEPGPTITPEEWAALERAVQAHFAAHRLLVCIGSVPLGSPVDGYARLVRLAHAQGLRVVVDATGALLDAALGAQPDVVTPNLFEATATLQGGHSAELVEGIERETLRRRAAVAAVELRRRGAGTAIVTAGKAGAAVATHAGVRWIAAPAVREVNPIGAGDAFVGGLAGALEEGQSLEMAAIAGTASAAASVETPLPGHLDPARAGALRSRIQIEAVQHAARGDVK